jgi:hypothetical protein
MQSLLSFLSRRKAEFTIELDAFRNKVWNLGRLSPSALFVHLNLWTVHFETHYYKARRSFSPEQLKALVSCVNS